MSGILTRFITSPLFVLKTRLLLNIQKEVLFLFSQVNLLT
jgi:hypothetical protein